MPDNKTETIEFTGTAKIRLHDIINNDFEQFLDMLCEGVGHPCLHDLDYEVVGHNDDTLHIRVSGLLDEEAQESEREQQERSRT